MNSAAIQNLENTMQRAALFELAISVIVLIVLFWATYYVIKAGVRDGIREAGLRDRGNNKPMAPIGYRWTLEKEYEDTKPMRAD